MQKKHDDRLERVREVVDEIIRRQPDIEQARCGFVHLYGVALLRVQLAHKRGLDAELCGIAGMLHDISSYKDAPSPDHPRLSALETERILGQAGGFSAEEIAAVSAAVAQHGCKERTDGAMAELLKDADVAQHYLYNPSLQQHHRQDPPAPAGLEGVRAFGGLAEPEGAMYGGTNSEHNLVIDLTLRPATAADSEFAYQTKKAAFRAYVEMVWGWDEAKQRQLHERRFAKQEFRVIQVSGADVGILALDRTPDFVKVNQLFILPEHQGKGAGRACMLRIIQEARAQSLPVRLQVLKVNTRALAFFRSMGFTEIGETDTHRQMERLP